MNLGQSKRQILQDPEFREKYEAWGPEYQWASELVKMRLARGMSQKDLAERINTKQASISRLESGRSLPCVSMVRRIAEALDATIEIRISPRHPTASSD